MDKNFSLPNLPAHIEETVRSLAQLHADHHQNATPHERAVARVTALLAHPRFIGGLADVDLPESAALQVRRDMERRFASSPAAIAAQ